MKFTSAIFLATIACLAAASPDPAVTPVAKRADSCVSLPDGPTDTGFDSQLPFDITVTATSSGPAPTIQCEHAADPDGAMGLCPNLSNDGWCDCGDAGTFQNLPGDNVCGYTAVPSTGSIALTTTNCVTSTAVQVITATVVPIPATTS